MLNIPQNQPSNYQSNLYNQNIQGGSYVINPKYLKSKS